MAATKEQITEWFDHGVAEGNTHMIVKCDTFERGAADCCYPVYVSQGQDPHEVEKANADKTREVYLLDPRYRDRQLRTAEVVLNYQWPPHGLNDRETDADRRTSTARTHRLHSD